MVKKTLNELSKKVEDKAVALKIIQTIGDSMLLEKTKLKYKKKPKD